MNELKKIDIYALINPIRDDIRNDLSINIDVYANEEITLDSCERSFVSTGLEIQCFIPLTHHIKFYGHTLPCGIETINRYQCSLVAEELKIQCANYHHSQRKIMKNTPLGKLVISPNIA